MSFYQVPPALLDLMSTFKHSGVILDRHFNGFVGEYTYSPDQRDSIIPISQLGRSGYYLKQCYRLRFLEKVHYQPFPWEARQVVVHHSFDIQNGQALWLTLEGNASLDERIRAMLSQCGFSRNYAQAFELTLSTHLMICQWCDENWQEFVESIEIELCQLKLTVRSTEPSSTSASRDRNHGIYSTATSSLGRPIQRFVDATISDRDQFLAPLQPRDSDLDSSISLDHLDPSYMYDLADIQKLYKVKDWLAEALLMARLNSSILSELREYYARLHSKVASRFAGNKSDLEDFVEKIGAFKSRMEVCQAQLEDLLSIQQDLKAQVGSAS